MKCDAAKIAGWVEAAVVLLADLLSIQYIEPNAVMLSK